MSKLSWWDKKRMGDIFFLAIGVLIIFLIVRQVMKNSPKKEKMMGNDGMETPPATPNAKPTESGFSTKNVSTRAGKFEITDELGRKAFTNSLILDLNVKGGKLKPGQKVPWCCGPVDNCGVAKCSEGGCGCVTATYIGPAT